MKNQTFLLYTIILFVVGGCSLNYNSAKIENVKMCRHMSGDQCAHDNPNFNTETPEIYVSCQLKNAPPETQVEFTWYYLGQRKIKIDAVTLSSGDLTGTLNMYSSLSKPNNGWPVGEYEVVIAIVGTEKEPVVKKFSVQ